MVQIYADADLRIIAEQAAKAWDDLIEPDFVFVDNPEDATIVIEAFEPGGTFTGVVITGGNARIIVDPDHPRVDATIGIGHALGLGRSDDPTSIMYGGTEVERPNADDIAAIQALHGADGGNNLLMGHEADNLFFGGEGSDFIFGAAGNDTIGGGTGDDVLFGGSGHDIIYASAGDDVIYAGDGNDVLYLGAGANTVYAGLGEDSIYGADGDDVIYEEPLIG